MRVSILILFLFVLLFSSCSIQKRHYRSGFFIEMKQGAVAANSKKAVCHAMAPRKIALPIVIKEQSVSMRQENSVGIPKKTGRTISKKSKLTSMQKNIARIFPVLIPIKKMAFHTGVIPDHVAKAAFRLMLIGLLFLGLAGFFLLQFPELAYVTVTLLIMATLFTAVAAFTAFNARHDKINNSETWLKLSLLTLILSLLIICAVVLFLILLF